MKKLLCIFIAFFAFILGLLTFHLFSTEKSLESNLVKSLNNKINTVIVVRDSVTKPANKDILSLYDATQNVGLYKEQKKYIKGYLEVNSLDSNGTKYYSLFDFNKNCFQQCLAESSLQLPQKNNREISNLIKELENKGARSNNQDGFIYAEVEVFGEIEESSACFAPPYRIKVEEIKQVSPIKFMSRAEFAEIIGKIKSSE
jgi:hypothetical protein